MFPQEFFISLLIEMSICGNCRSIEIYELILHIKCIIQIITNKLHKLQLNSNIPDLKEDPLIIINIIITV